MTRWARIEELFHAALERAPAERDAFLDAACGGDEELRREVESLLAHEPEADRLMDEPAADAATQRLAVVRGMHLGPYEVEGLIGSGGMGEVYRARDTRLGRDVAVKILPLTFAHDVERLKRFELEARAVASLNHPHILTVHDVGAHEGTPYVVTELLEGETLREVLARRAPPLKQALSFAIHAAQGLAAAHRKGVVHRDVKPDNLFVTSDGQLKILDFGLAKRLTAPVDAGPSPTVPEATRDGIVLGTVAYMSPEQAQSLAVDARSDIFSFGVVLYELLTGKHPFRRETPASTLGAILDAEPKAPGDIAAGLPHDLEKIVLRCLRKDPARRFQHMDDVELELEEVSAELVAQRAEAQPPAPAHRRRRWTGGAAAALALVGVSGWLWWSLSPGKPTPPSVVQLTSYVGREITPALSPDGRQVAFAWDGERQDNFDIYVQMIEAEGLPLRLTKDSASDLYPAWSPDGRQLAFRRASKTATGLYVVPALGGPERRVADLAPTDSGITFCWTHDGNWLAGADAEGISLIPLNLGERRRLISEAEHRYSFPALSPDGRLLASMACRRKGGGCDVQLLPLSAALEPAGPPRRLATEFVSTAGLTWAPDARSLICAASREGARTTWLWRVPLVGAAPPERIELAGVRPSGPSASRAVNRLVFSRDNYDLDIWKLDNGGRPEPLIASTRLDTNPQFSPDGKRLAFASNRTVGAATGRDTTEIFVSDADGSNVMQLTHGPGRMQGSPAWSPDGRQIAFDSLAAGRNFNVYVVDAVGGTPRPVAPGSDSQVMPKWSRDGRFIYFASNRTGRNEIWRAPAGGGEPVQVTQDGGFAVWESMDGATLYYVKKPAAVRSAAQPLFARPVAGGEEAKVLDGLVSQWFAVSADGVYYFGARNDSRPGVVLRVFDLTTRTSRDLAVIDTTPGYGLTSSPDQKTVLFSCRKTENADLMLIESFR